MISKERIFSFESVFRRILRYCFIQTLLIRALLIGAPLIGVMFLSSCALKNNPEQQNSVESIIKALEDVEQAQLSRLPQIKTGDVYVFSNPQESWEVIDVNNDVVTWVSHNGIRTVSNLNPLLPILEWKSPDLETGRRLISNIQGNIFPMKKGKKMSFKTTVSIGENENTWSFNWRCVVGDQDKVTVAAGEFLAFRVVCARDKTDRITYHFAPRLGYFIRMEVGGTGGIPLKRRDLVSYDNVTGSSASLRQRANREASLQARADQRIITNDSNVAVLPLPAPDGLVDRTAPRSQGNNLDVSGNVPSQNFIQSLDLSASERLLSNQSGSLVPESRSITGGRLGTSRGSVSGSTTRGAFERNPLAQNLIDDAVDRISPNNQNIASLNPGQTSGATVLEGIGIHLASYGSLEAARSGWQQLAGRFGDILIGKKPIIRAVDLGLRGTVFRLYATSFVNLTTANQACEQLKARQAFCRVSELGIQ